MLQILYMKTSTFILIIVMTLVTSCTVQKSLFKEVDNQKEFITNKYGEPDETENVNGNEVWIYNKNMLVKGGRVVIFDKEGRIVSNTKDLSPVGVITRGIVLGYVSLGLFVILLMSGS